MPSATINPCYNPPVGEGAKDYAGISAIAAIQRQLLIPQSGLESRSQPNARSQPHAHLVSLLEEAVNK